MPNKDKYVKILSAIIRGIASINIADCKLDGYFQSVPGMFAEFAPSIDDCSKGGKLTAVGYQIDTKSNPNKQLQNKDVSSLPFNICKTEVKRLVKKTLTSEEFCVRTDLCIGKLGQLLTDANDVVIGFGTDESTDVPCKEGFSVMQCTSTGLFKMMLNALKTQNVAGSGEYTAQCVAV